MIDALALEHSQTVGLAGNGCDVSLVKLGVLVVCGRGIVVGRIPQSYSSPPVAGPGFSLAFISAEWISVRARGVVTLSFTESTFVRE